MKQTRLFALLLASLLVTSAVTACGGDDTSTVDTTANTTGTSVETEPVEDDIFSQRMKVADNLPEKDFGGRVFRLLNEGHVGSFAEQDGDVVNDAIYSRNFTVSERFNVIFEDLKQDGYQTTEKFIGNAIKAGDDAFDLAISHSISMGSLALEDYFLNWYDIPYVDFTKPWWPATTREDLSFDEVCPLAIGDFALMSMGQTICLFFNSTQTANYDFPDLYALVRDGKWTYDTMISLAKDIYVDNNQDGKEDSGDMYGVAVDTANRVNMFYWAFDNPLMATENGELKITYRTEKLTEFIAALIDDFSSYKGCVFNEELSDGSLPDFFNGNVLLSFAYFNQASYLRDMEDDFGILPLPKWNEAQDGYYTYPSGSAPVLAVPTTAADTEFIGIISEALNAESYKQVVPVYYETAMKDKYARDEETLEMIDLIMQGRVVDMGFVYDGWEGAGYIPSKLIQKNDTNVESYIEKNEKTINKRYDQIIEYFTTYKDTH